MVRESPQTDSGVEAQLACEGCGTPVVRGFQRCSACYKPLNPTFGWLIHEYHNRGMSRADYLSATTQYKTKSSLEKWLLGKLGITPVKSKRKEDQHVER